MEVWPFDTDETDLTGCERIGKMRRRRKKIIRFNPVRSDKSVSYASAPARSTGVSAKAGRDAGPTETKLHKSTSDPV